MSGELYWLMGCFKWVSYIPSNVIKSDQYSLINKTLLTVIIQSHLLLSKVDINGSNLSALTERRMLSITIWLLNKDFGEMVNNILA